MLEKEIALTASRIKIPFRLHFLHPSLVTNFLYRISILLESGILLPQALDIMRKQIKNKAFYDVIDDITAYVKEGGSFHSILMAYPYLFDQFVAQIVAVGEESGSLVKALKRLVYYRQLIEKFFHDIKAAAIVPGIALFVFCGVAAIIFMVVIPMFATLFEGSRLEIPRSTQMIIRLSSIVTSPSFFIGMIGFFIVFFTIFSIARKKYQEFFEHLLISLPVVGTIMRGIFRLNFLHSLALLIGGGVHMVSALHIASDGISHKILKKQIKQVADAVFAGSLLHQELANCSYGLFPEEMVTLVAVGEESGRLEDMLQYAALVAEDQVRRYLQRCSTLFQPIFIFILAILIVLLICSIYIPIFNFSQIVM